MPQPPVPSEVRLLVQAALPHVAFDGWSPETLRMAAGDIGLPADRVAALLPRGAVDLAAAFHRMGDEDMAERLSSADPGALRYRDRVAAALRLRIEVIPDREAVRRGLALLALPHLAPLGAQLVWGTADRIWTALGDTSDDLNWYTKRATLAGVWSATVLYWLGDDSDGATATAAFIDRRIDEVMRIEGAKARVRQSPLFRPVAGMFAQAAARVRPPGQGGARPGWPGAWGPRPERPHD